MLNRLNIDEFVDRIYKRKVWIWGAKTVGLSVCAMIERCRISEVAGILDSNPEAQGRKIRGHGVITPDQFFEFADRKNDFIVIASGQYYDQIANICLEHNFVEGDDFCAHTKILGAVYEIDLVSACNLKCPSCPQGNYQTKLPAAKMTINKFKRILDKVLREMPNVANISLFSWGEPFLHPELPEFIKLVKAAGIPCFISSNLSHNFALEPVIAADPDYFRISLSGYTQDVYQIDHSGGDINLVKSNMYRLRYLIDKYNADTYVEVAYHKYKYNIGNEYCDMQRLCGELKFGFAPFVAAILPLENMLELCENKGNHMLASLSDRLLFDMDKLAEIDMRGQEDKCYSFYNMIVIMPSGHVLVCDFTYDIEKSCIAKDYLDIDIEDLYEAKLNNEICKKCLKHGIPQMLAAIIDDNCKYEHLHKERM